MDGIGQYPDTGALRPGVVWMCGGFAPNGNGTVASTSFRGSLKKRMTVSRSNTGLFLITLAAGLTFPEVPIIETSQSYDGTNVFWATITYPNSNGWQNTGTNARQFNIQCLTSGGSATDVTADPRAFISFFIEGINNTGA